MFIEYINFNPYAEFFFFLFEKIVISVSNYFLLLLIDYIIFFYSADKVEDLAKNMLGNKLTTKQTPPGGVMVQKVISYL